MSSLEEEIDRLTIHETTTDNNATSSPSGLTDQTSPDETVTTTTTTPDTVIKRYVSNSSLFENDQHLFEYIDETTSANSKSWPVPLESPDSLKEKPEGEDNVQAYEENSIERGPSVTFNFLDEDTLDTKSSVTDGDDGEKTDEEYKLPDDEQTHEEYFMGCPEDKSLMGPPDHECHCRSETPVSGGRSSKGRAPLPPTDQGIPHPVPPPNYFCEGPQNCPFSIPYPHKNHYHICPQFKSYNYSSNPQSRVRFYQVGYNTNWRKMPENWVRMKGRYHAKGGERLRTTSSYSHYDHYGYGKSWLAYAFAPLIIPLRYSLPSSRRSRKEYFSHGVPKGHGGLRDFDYSLCTCCVCCNCAKTNQTNCCCCYHCTHTTSACRRSDILRMVPVPYSAEPGAGAIVSILKKKNVDIHPEGGAVITELEQSHELEQEEFHPDNKPSLAITSPDCNVILRDALDSEGNETEGLAAPSPSVSGPTPTTEPTDLDAVEDVSSTIIIEP